MTPRPYTPGVSTCMSCGRVLVDVDPDPCDACLNTLCANCCQGKGAVRTFEQRRPVVESKARPLDSLGPDALIMQTFATESSPRDLVQVLKDLLP